MNQEDRETMVVMLSTMLFKDKRYFEEMDDRRLIEEYVRFMKVNWGWAIGDNQFWNHGEAQAQGKPRAGKSSSSKTVLYDSVTFRDFKQYVKLVASQRKPQKLIKGPLYLELIFYQPTPKKYTTKPK